MKICPNCQRENDDLANFCEECGYSLKDVPIVAKHSGDATVANNEEQINGNKSESRMQAQPVKRNYKPLLVTIFVVVFLLAGAGIFFASRNNGSTNEATSVTTNSSTKSRGKETSETVEAGKYDEVIKAAKELTIDGKYKESERKLASIPVSDLAKPEFQSVQLAVTELTQQNSTGIKETKEAELKKAQQAEEKKTVSNQSGFTGDHAKWANTYTFYYSQSNQKQSSLNISANGGVTQNNYDGTQYFGQAVISNTSGNILSYETNALYPSDMPNTKTIHPNVKITVTWDNGGGTQAFYGYLSYSSRLALTDGVKKGNGVNEVWVSY